MSSTESSKHTPIRFALVGCGSIAPTQIKALQTLPNDALLAYLVDKEPERAEEMGKTFGVATADLATVLADPNIDALTFCTPSGVHGDLAARALAAGKHVVIEKPMEVNLAACDELLAAHAQAKGRQLAVISQHRFDPASQQISQLVERGDLGNIFFAEAKIPWYRTQEYYDSADWRGTYAYDGGGCLMNQGIHTVDLLLWFAGPVESVHARMATAAHERIEVEDVITATLTFKSGMIGTLTASTAFYPGFPAKVGLYGTQGSVILEGDELQTLALVGQDTVTGAAASAHAQQVASGGTRSATAHAEQPDESKWKWGDAHRAQFADFIAAIRENRPPLVDGQAGRAAVALIHACYDAARSGETVKL